MSYPDLPITLVPLGWAGVKRSVEDEVFARYLSDRLQGQAPDIDEVTREIMGAELIRRFQDPKDLDFPEKDLEYCLSFGRYTVVPKLSIEDDLPVLRDVVRFPRY